MTNNLPPRVVSRRGISLLELSVTISVLVLIINIIYIGANAWKRGSDRSQCILSQRNVQQATRCYQNLYGYAYGGSPSAESGSQDIAHHLLEKGYIEKPLYDQAVGADKCPSGGLFTCPSPSVFPLPGELYMKCSLASSLGHLPTDHADW